MRKSLYRELESIGREEMRTYGRPPTRMAKSNPNLPTDLIFYCEETEDVYKLDSSGVSQFLRKCNYPAVPENIDWLLDNLLNTSITKSFYMDDYTLSISCKCAFDPQDRSLSELGITKSMVSRPVSSMPVTNHVQKELAVPVGYGGNTGQTLYGGIPIGDGQGVLLGIEVPRLYKMLKSRPDYAQQHDMSNNGGLLADTNVVGFARPKISKMNQGWQE